MKFMLLALALIATPAASDSWSNTSTTQLTSYWYYFDSSCKGTREKLTDFNTYCSLRDDVEQTLRGRGICKQGNTKWADGVRFAECR